MATARRQSEPLGLFSSKPTPRLYDAAFVALPSCLAGCLAAADDTPKPCNALEMTCNSTNRLIAFDLQKTCACVLGRTFATYR